MARRAVLFAIAAFAGAAYAAAPEECAEQPAGEVVVKALRFSDGRSYAYLVTNSGATPIRAIYIGWGAFIEIDYSTRPTSIGSPSGWRGMDAWVPDPRWPQSHSPRLIQYLWEAEDPDAWIQPGRSLSGFSIQLPTPHESALAYLRVSKVYNSLDELPKDPPFEERLDPQPDLASVPFQVGRSGACDAEGTVELDGGSRPLIQALILGTALPLAGQIGAAQPVELDPCSTLLRPGTMDENGIVTRKYAPLEFATSMTRECDYVLLGRFVSVSDRHYDGLYGPADEPVALTFQVSEVLRGKSVAAAKVGVRRPMLVAPGEKVSRFLSSQAEDRLYRYRLVNEVESELAAIQDSGRPVTKSQQERLTDAVKRMVQVAPRSRRQQHELAKGYFATNSPLSFYSELGAIRPDEVYLLGLREKGEPKSPRWTYFNAVHTYLFWSQEAQDIAAALRE